jgi:uncharacterized PurR-regulated membrane protein YhhQ (DUF165 family)
MKVWTNGRYISARFVTSTLCGQIVNTAVFYVFGLWGMIPNRVLTKSIVVASITKVAVELSQHWCGEPPLETILLVTVVT